MISNVISLPTSASGTCDTSATKKMAASANISELSSDSPYAMYAEVNISPLNRTNIPTALLGADTHTNKAVPDHLVSEDLSLRQTGGLQFQSVTNTKVEHPLEQLSVPVGIAAQARPSTQALYSNASTNLSLASSTHALAHSQTTSLPIATHLVTAPLNVQSAGEKITTLGLPLALTDPRAMESIEGTNHLLASTTRPLSQVSQWGPVPVTPSAPQAQQAQELLSPLREQLRFQIDQQIKKAELRLDPPELGKVELSIRLDGDRLHIQMHAANASVRDSLLIGLDRLRAELAMDHGGQIDVDIGQGEKEQKEPTSDGESIAVAKQDNLESHKSQNKQQAVNGIDLLA